MDRDSISSDKRMIETVRALSEKTNQYIMHDPVRQEGWVLGQRGDLPLCFPLEGHVMTFGRSGAGKGTSVAIPNLLQHRGSVVSFEVGGATFRETWGFRKFGLKQKVRVIDPYGITGYPSDRVNLLAEIRKTRSKGDALFVSAAKQATLALFEDVDSGGNDTTFQKSAIDIIVGHIVFMCGDDSDLTDDQLTLTYLQDALTDFGKGTPFDLAQKMNERVEQTRSKSPQEQFVTSVQTH